MMGAGKSTIGKLLAKTLDVRFVDADYELEKKLNDSISTVFKEKGETFFRTAELDFLMQDVPFIPPAVIATGGGMPCYNNAIDLLKSSGKVIWLNAPIEDMVLRLKGNLKKRPLLIDKVDQLEGYVYNLLEQRKPIYSQAHIVVDTANSSKEQTVERILKAIN